MFEIVIFTVLKCCIFVKRLVDRITPTPSIEGVACMAACTLRKNLQNSPIISSFTQIWKNCQKVLITFDKQTKPKPLKSSPISKK